MQLQEPPHAEERDVRAVRSEELLQDSNEVRIMHRGDVYRLRLTRAGKLILHK
ncbi:MAG: hemin uptake protein HemP [Planctomycetota bacterium]